MKFGICYELQLPRPWHQDSEGQLEDIDAEQFQQRYGAKSVRV